MRGIRKALRGYSAVELAIVVAIFVVILAVAIPKYDTLRYSAKVSFMESIHAAMISSSNYIYAKSLLAEQEFEENGAVDIDGVKVKTRYGFPAEDEILSLMNIDTNRFDVEVLNGKIIHKDVENPENCQVDYDPPNNPGEPPRIRLSKELTCR